MHEIYLPSLYRPQSTCIYCKSLLIYIFFPLPLRFRNRDTWVLGF